jgi:uncharacterized membrane protein
MRRAWRAILAEYVAMSDHWRHHPAVPSHDELSLGERSADRLRNGMGSWSFVFAALAFLAAWMLVNRGSGFDPYPFILLNLVLSCLAALQGAILLIAAKRSDAVSAIAATGDYEVNRATKTLVEQQWKLLAEMRADHAKLLVEVQALRTAQTAGGAA